MLFRLLLTLATLCFPDMCTEVNCGISFKCSGTDWNLSGSQEGKGWRGKWGMHSCPKPFQASGLIRLKALWWLNRNLTRARSLSCLHLDVSWLNWCLTGSCLFSLVLILFFRESYDRLYLDVFVSVWHYEDANVQPNNKGLNDNSRTTKMRKGRWRAREPPALF